MTASIPLDNLIGSVPFSQAEWDQTPSAVQAHLIVQDTNLHALQAQLEQLQQQVDQLQGRLDQTSSTSSNPPHRIRPLKSVSPVNPRASEVGKRAMRVTQTA